MPHTPSAYKRMRQFAKRNLYNRVVKSVVKTALHKFDVAAKAGDPAKTKAALIEAIGQLDKARLKGVLHRNTVARRKSALMRQANKPAEKKA